MLYDSQDSQEGDINWVQMWHLNVYLCVMVVLFQQEQTAALTKRNPLSSVSGKGKGKRAKLSMKETSHGSTNIATQGNCSEDGPICDKGYSRAGQGRRRRSCRTQQVEGKFTPGMVNGNPVQENGIGRDNAACDKTASKPSCCPIAIGNILEVEMQPVMSSQRTEAASLKRSHSANCADEVVTSTSSQLNTTSTNKSPTTLSPVQELNHNVVKRSSTQSVSEGGKLLANPVSNLENNPVNKLPIPRLSNPNKPTTKQLANVIIFPPILQQKSPKFKYKPIQPKPDNVGDKKRCGGDEEGGSAKQTDVTSTGVVVLAGGTKKELSSVSIGCLEKDALDDYLHGGNNSQEQEEELMRYFQHQNSSSSNEEPEDGTRREASETYPATTESSKSDKLSQLRLLLERNLNQAPCVSRGGPFKTTGGRSAPQSSTETPSSSVSFEDLTDANPGNGDVFLPNSAAGNHTATAGPASTSLSLLSQRSQNCAAGKPALLLANGGTHTSFGSRRRVSFETSVMEHYHDGVHHTTASVPPSPNTRRRIFSFTPISPGPHSPLGPQRASSKPSSANASPFVSPRNTPVPRSRHNSGQTALNQSVSFLATHQMQNCGNVLTLSRSRHSTMAAKVVRSNSVNSHSIGLPQYQAPRPRAMSITTPMLQTVRDNILPGQTNGHCDTESSNMFAVPGELHLPAIQAGSRQTVLNASAAPMSPLSVSAPQSPMIPFQQSVSSASSLLSVPSTNLDQFSASQSLLQEVLHTTNTPGFTKETFVSTKHKMATQDSLLPDTVDVANQPAAGLSMNVDPLAQEVSQFFPDDQNFTSVLTTSIGLQPSSHRSQSVPLHRMTSASQQQQQQESPLYVNHSTTAFNFNHFTSSARSSVAATPVPSEFTDFVSAGDSSTAPSTDLLLVNGVAETTELNSENLNRIFNLLDDVQQEEQQKEQHQMLTLGIDAAQQHNQKFLFQPSRSYPNTPLPYQSISNTRDPVVGSSATCLPSESNATLTSRSYPSTPLIGHPMFGGSEDDGPFQQELENVSSVKSVSQLTLNALNIRTTGPSFAARRNINSLLEQPSFSVDDELALDTLDALHECDTLSQFVQEVSSPASDACT